MPASASINYVNPQASGSYVSLSAVLSYVAAQLGPALLVWNLDYDYSQSAVLNEAVLGEFSLG